MRRRWKVVIGLVVVAAALYLGLGARRLPLWTESRRAEEFLTDAPRSEASRWCVGEQNPRPAPSPNPLPPEGLTVLSANEASGLSGAFRMDRRVIYFRAQRGGVNDEYFALFHLLGDTTPKYSVGGALLDRFCSPFSSQESGRTFAEATTEEEIAAHQEDMRLSNELNRALKAAAISSRLAPELDTLFNLGSPFARLRPWPPGSLPDGGLESTIFVTGNPPSRQP
jgi:hypothetical protein